MKSVIEKGARRALTEWYTGQWDRQEDALPDLAQDLWVWYLENPSTQRKMEKLSEPEQVETARLHAIQLLSKQQLTANTFDGKDLFSGEAVKTALKGKSSNPYLRSILPFAMRNLDKRNEDYAEAIRSRYTDGIVPPQGALQVRLSYAIKSLTEEVNAIYITSEDDGAGSSHKVFPDSRRRQGDTSDPTGDIAVMLIEHPDMAESYLAETPLVAFLRGRAATRVRTLPDGRQFRPEPRLTQVHEERGKC